MSQSQNAKNKRRGAAWELDILKWIRSETTLPAERLRLTGKKDEGDVAVGPDHTVTYVIEAKDAQRIDLAGWTTEALTEADNYAAARGLDRDNVWPLVVIKRRGKSVEHAYVVTPLGEFFR